MTKSTELAKATSIVLITLITACASKDPLYCDPQTPCTDPNRPFCDLEGTTDSSKGIARTCVPIPESILTLVRSGDGTVLSTPPGIDCGEYCVKAFRTGTRLSLEATPDDEHWHFAGWGGASDCGTDAQCLLELTESIQVSAIFERFDYGLAVLVVGDGTITSQPAGIDCGNDCSSYFESEEQVELTARADLGWSFGGWAGGCSGAAATCEVTLTSTQTTVDATFLKDRALLTVTLLGNGPGRVFSNPIGIDCYTGGVGDCSASFIEDTNVTLTAEPSHSPPSSLESWSIPTCTGLTCGLTLEESRNVTATFNRVEAAVRIDVAGTGSGEVVLTSSNAPENRCVNSSCSYDYWVEDEITFTAQVLDQTTAFMEWSGECTAEPCQLAVPPQGLHATARFEETRLTVVLTSSTGGIVDQLGGNQVDCSTSTCSAVFNIGSQVDLVAQPHVGYFFERWMGDCGGLSPSCSVTMDGQRTVSAIFLPFPQVANGQLADLVLGQPDFTSDTPDNGGQDADSLNLPRYCASDGKRLWVADSQNARVLQWNSEPTMNKQPADVVIGQPTFTRSQLGTYDNRLQDRTCGIDSDWGRLFVVDMPSSRIIGWNTIPSSNNMSADFVIGQVHFEQAWRRLEQNRFDQPYDLWVGDGMMFVADTFNHRVLIYHSIPTTIGLHDADVVLGQPSFDMNNAPDPPNASSMKYPYGVEYDPRSGKLFVADTNNRRILGWNSLPTTNGAPADFVLGQPDFVSNALNPNGVTAAAMGNSRHTLVIGDHLFVADGSNYRVMVWSPLPSTTGISANAVIGQTDLTSRVAGPTQLHFQPWGLCHLGTNLYVVASSRVLRFPLAP